ncbi:MAG: DUF2279 domain-containing protein [Bacteroidia bacterium]|nr:DUF2279 domain-containing protein [Bacteroidia bacterium]
MKYYYSVCFLLLSLPVVASQDSIPAGRKYRTAGVILAGSGASIWVLNNAWYSNYPKESFHFFNDNAEWLQMDKTGHMLSAFHIGQFGHHLFKWSGMEKNRSLLWGGGLGTMYLGIIEILDGFSSGWGFSTGDMIANVTGSALYITQVYAWNDTRITPKFSAHLTSFAASRPELLGESSAERILKDYNGQTCWLSLNIRSFFSASSVPHWFNVAFGYGATGMVGGRPEVNDPFVREREWYFSLDADLWRIPGIRNSVFGKILRSFGFVKIPFPALRYSGGRLDVHPFYF